MVERLESERRDSALRALAAQESERRRIALELHDEVGQALTGGDAAARPGDVEAAKEGLRAALEEVREIARRLRPEALDDLGLRNALRALVASVARDARIDVIPEIEADLPPLSPEQELVVYRVAQEALTNAVRHADAGALRLLASPRRRRGAAQGGRRRPRVSTPRSASRRVGHPGYARAGAVGARPARSRARSPGRGTAVTLRTPV